MGTRTRTGTEMGTGLLWWTVRYCTVLVVNLGVLSLRMPELHIFPLHFSFRRKHPTRPMCGAEGKGREGVGE